MAEIDEMREDGEISDEGGDNETEIYQKIERPQILNNTRNITNEPYKSESSDDNYDSDEDGLKRIPKRLEKPQTSSLTGSRSKNGHLWKSMIQEETLMETMKTIDVTRKRKNDRGAEAYDFPGFNATDDDKRKWKKRRLEHSGNESSSSNSSSRSRKRRKNINRHKKYMPVSRVLPPMESKNIEGPEVEEFANELAENLEEQNLDLIRRVVTVIGKAASLEIYKTTQDVEREGGMLTMNRARRRTPGGVFLFLLKESSFVDDESRKQIFTNDKKPAERKMSSEQMSKIPPNSPENSDYVENEQRKLTDPDLISQKILNFTNDDGGNIFETDHNNEMDIF